MGLLVHAYGGMLLQLVLLDFLHEKDLLLLGELLLA